MQFIRHEAEPRHSLKVSGVSSQTEPQRDPSGARMHELWVPATFWDDHADRVPADDGDAGVCREVARAAARVRIRGSSAQLQVLHNDAAFYTGKDGPDECPPAIRRSAVRTVGAINRYLALQRQFPAPHEEPRDVRSTRNESEAARMRRYDSQAGER